MAQRKDSFFLAARSVKKTDRPQKETFKKRTEEKKNDSETSEKVKKPFDKKAYRFKKYSNKYKLDKWEDQRKKRLLRTFYKDVKNDAPLGSYKPVNFDEELSNSDEETQEHCTTNEKRSGMDVTDSSSAGRFVRHPDLMEAVPSLKSETKEVVKSTSAKKNAFRKAKEEMARLKLNKEQKKKELDRSKEEREQKLNEYRKKKAERFKKLSRKTKKGQPVMTGRLELLLEKIVSNK